MSTINGTVENSVNGSFNTKKVSWTLTGTNDGAPAKFPDFPDRSVQITGTFDTTTVVLEGSNDGSNYQTLTDDAGNALSFTAAGLKQSVVYSEYVRPRITADGGSGSITITMEFHRSR